MKKIISISALVFASVMFAGTAAFAANALSQQPSGSATAVPGDTITLANTAGGGSGPNLTFSPSPNNIISVASISNAYAIQGTNQAASPGDRNEYAVYSGMTGYYQRVNSSTADPAVIDNALTTSTNLTSDPFHNVTGWVSMGGGGS